MEGFARHIPRRAQEGPSVPQEQVPSEPSGMDPLQESAVPEGADAAATAHLGAQRREDRGRAAAVRERDRERYPGIRHRRRPRRSGRDRRPSAVDGRRRERRSSSAETGR